MPTYRFSLHFNTVHYIRYTSISILAIREENRGKFLKEKAEAEKRTADSVEESKNVEVSEDPETQI